MGRVPIPYIYQYIDSLQNPGVLPNLIERQERHIKRRSGQSFNHSGITVILLLVQCVMHHVAAPGAHSPPAVQHGHSLLAEGLRPSDVVIKLPKLLAHAFYFLFRTAQLVFISVTASATASS